jgi:hypothetical protein
MKDIAVGLTVAVIVLSGAPGWMVIGAVLLLVAAVVVWWP